ncbi:MAG TPA: hypothetical protein VLA49_09175 [Anaerolineales bacterium]|nr:hypothetical protein [Anaerolineales bacterium]
MNKQTSQPQPFNLYDFQLRAMPVLLAWGTASLFAGLAWLFNPKPWRAGFGLQFAAWGFINSLIALLGQGMARRNKKRLKAGEINQAEHKRQAAQFERLLRLNAVLDICYMLAGGWLITRRPQETRRQGMGWGVVVQGGALLIWDLLLERLLHNRRQSLKLE